MEAGMKLLSIESSRALAEQHGWSLEYARGFVDGETCRRLGHTPPRPNVIGIDNYSLGFRAGYFERRHQERGRTEPGRELDQPVAIAAARVSRG
jgi:hypothetical protein